MNRHCLSIALSTALGLPPVALAQPVMSWTPQSQVLSASGKTELVRGHLLLQSERGLLGRKTTEAQASLIRVQCQGTVVMSHLPGEPVSVTCVEGHATLRMQENASVFMEIQPGEMIMVPKEAGHLPEASVVRLKRLTESHPLLTTSQQAQNEAIQAAVAKQEKAINKGKLLVSKVTVKGGRATVASAGGSSDGSRQSGSSSASSGSSSSSASSSSGSTASSGSSSSAGGVAAAGCG